MSETSITGSKAGITVAAMAAALMAVLDISIVNVALSDIRASFGTPLDQIAWVSTGYMMANVVVIPMTGWLQRRFGYRRYFTASILIFTAASALCGLAWNLPSLVMFRMLQGLGGGAIIPTAQSILFARYPRKEHGIAGALFGLGAITGPLLGPTVGGYLIDMFSWHWIFLINVPVGLFAAWMAYRNIEEPGWQRPDEPIDTFGIALLAVGMGSLQYVLEEGNRNDWFQSFEIVVLTAVAVVSLVTFVVRQLETTFPVVDLRIFRNTAYSAATGINFLVGVALFSATYLFSLYCGVIVRYSARDIGHVFLVAGLVQIVGMPLVGRFGGRFDGRVLLFFGVLLVALSLWMTTQYTSAIGFWDLTRPRMVLGAGLSLIFIPLSILALSDLDPKQRGNATGLFNLTRELGGSIGTALMGMMVTDRARIHAAHLAEHVTPYDPVTQQQVAQMAATVGAGTTDPTRTAHTLLSLRIQNQAMVRAFTDAFGLVAAVIACSVLLVFLLRKPEGDVDVAGAH